MNRLSPGVSICIPNWNHRNFLPRSITSAKRTAIELKRGGFDCEIIVIDDGSRDGSLRALAGMMAQEPTGLIDVIPQPENKGLAASRNRALSQVRFQYVCFLDADNELIPENLPLFKRAIEKTRAAAVYGNLIAHDGTEVVDLKSNDYVSDALYENNYIDAFALYDAAKLIAHGGYDEKLKSHEDWEMFLHLIAEGEDIVFVPACMGYYYVVPLSMVKTEKFDHQIIHRIYNQKGTGLPASWKNCSVYHPDTGWLVGGDPQIKDR